MYGFGTYNLAAVYRGRRIHGTERDVVQIVLGGPAHCFQIIAASNTGHKGTLYLLFDLFKIIRNGIKMNALQGSGFEQFPIVIDENGDAKISSKFVDGGYKLFFFVPRYTFGPVVPDLQDIYSAPQRLFYLLN